MHTKWTFTFSMMLLLLVTACNPPEAQQPTSQPTTDPPTLTSTFVPSAPPLATMTPLPQPTATPSPLPVPDSRQIAPCEPASFLASSSPIPAPTGPYQVGLTAFQLVDAARPEYYNTVENDYRIVTVFVWYPADAVDDAVPCSYTGTFERGNSSFDLAAPGIEDDPSMFQRLSRWSLQAFPDAPVSEDQAIYPVVVYSNILSGLPINQSSQLRELASHGFIVLDVIHTYGYSVGRSGTGPVLVNGISLDARVHGSRSVEDILFVISQLVELDNNQSTSMLAGRFDLDRIGIAGWSLGGFVSAAAAHDQVKAGIVFDGALLDSAPTLTQPFLLMSAESSVNAAGMDSAYADAEGHAYQITIDGFVHGSFSDMVLWPEEPTSKTIVRTGTIDGLRAIEIVNAYIVAFFDQYLRDNDRVLLDGPSADYPEVSFESRNTD